MSAEGGTDIAEFTGGATTGELVVLAICTPARTPESVHRDPF